MKVVFKTIIAVLIFVFYFVIFCAINGVDSGDPWDKVMNWAKGKTKGGKIYDI